MQIEILGYFIIPLGIILLFFNKKWLLYMTALFAGFTATSILRIGRRFISTTFILFRSIIYSKTINRCNKKQENDITR